MEEEINSFIHKVEYESLVQAATECNKISFRYVKGSAEEITSREGVLLFDKLYEC